MIKKLLFIMFYCQAAFAMLPPAAGVGAVANNLMEPVEYLSNFIYTACFVIGGSFVFASIIKYAEHRRNPLAVPIGTPVFLLLAGLALVSLPFAYLVVHHGQPYVLLNQNSQ